MKILVLSEEEIAPLLDMEEAICHVEAAFSAHAKGTIKMPPKVYLDFGIGDLRVMPAYWPAKKTSSVKIVNSHPKNPSLGLPAVMAATWLMDPTTGEPLALIAATALTDIRTGAAGAVAARHLARKNSATAGLIGCGRQARTQLSGLRRLFPIQLVKVAGKNLKESEQFCKTAENNGGLIPVKELAAACDADIVITTTPSRSPIVRAGWIRPGTHINAIGADAPGKQELDSKILENAVVVVDDLTQAVHSGEVNVPIAKGKITRNSIHASLGEVIIGKKKGRTSDRQITLFDSTGLAILDLAIGHLVYQKAILSGAGRVISL